ncbi:MAG: thioredoxin family protein [Candidatus Babeliales bacterium]
MKKLAIALLFCVCPPLYSASNIIPLEKLMFYSIVADNAKEKLAHEYPEYTAWLSDTNALLLLNFITTTDKPVIIKFGADWCMPCKSLAPIVHEAAFECSNDVLIIDINIDDAPTIRQMFDIQTIPTLIYFKNGKQKDRTHSVSKATLLTKIKHLIDLKSPLFTP